MAKKLIAFYSRADENYVSGALKMLSTGNTDVVAHRKNYWWRLISY